MQQTLKVLAVFDADDLPTILTEVFARESIGVHHARSGAAALVLTGNSLYDLLILGEPLSDLPVESVLNSLQSFEWASAGTPALILAAEGDVAELSDRLERHPARVLARSAQRHEVQQAISELLGVPVRSTSRMLVNVEVKTQASSSLKCFQSENISESGLLLRGRHAIPIGMAVKLEFNLPDEREPVRGTAMVVRHSGNGENPGVGLRFVELNRDAILRLRRFVDRTLAETPPVGAGAGAGSSQTAGV